jgi:hypothetical protein
MKKTSKKIYFVEFRGKPFLGLAQLSKIYYYYYYLLFSVNIKPLRHHFGHSLCLGFGIKPKPFVDGNKPTTRLIGVAKIETKAKPIVANSFPKTKNQGHI